MRLALAPAGRALVPAGLLVVAALMPAAAAAAPVRGDPGTARLAGEFVMVGRVTVAQNIKGERRGQSAKRQWTFTAGCASGQCRTLSLARQRAGGTDHLTLARKSPGYYTGTGLFYAPLRCAAHDYKRGESVPFTITVRITAAQIVNGHDVATIVHATYTNRSRQNRTRCVAIPGHDAAVYDGLLMTLPAPPTGGVSGQSPAGS